MEQHTDIRWMQRYSNFHKACRRLLQVTEADRFLEDLSELEIEGLVQRFEYTFELSWKVMQDLLLYKGYEFMSGPNGTLKMAFEDGLIDDHDGWNYAPLLKQLDTRLEELKNHQNYQQL